MARAHFLCLIFLASILSSDLGHTAMADVINQGRCYDGTGGEIACTGTGQDGDLQAGTIWPEPRFTDNGDGTVTDALTGLAWLKDAGCLGRANRSGAQEKVEEFNVQAAASGCAEYQADYDDWRLPEVRELESLTNLTAPDQAEWLAAAGFANVGGAGYWSATTAASAYNGWLVELAAGAVDYAPTTSFQSIWPVRGAGDHGPSGEPSLPRFTANDDGTVTDQKTGLNWLQNADAYADRSWSEALALIANLNSEEGEGAAAADWRLPNRRELQSLLDYQRDYPALPPDAPFHKLHASYYWTSSTAVSSPAHAWAVHPVYGQTRPLGKSEHAAVWPVRTPPLAASRLAQTADWLRGRNNSAGEARLAREVIGDSLPRFTSHSDGTITDNLTGLMWLADGACLGKRSWPKAREAVASFNSDGSSFQCEGYTASYQDWLIPGLEQLEELSPPTGTDAVSWLNDKGFKDVQPHGYWTENASKTNLYYAWLFNLRAREKRKYPKDFRFFALPYRLPR